MKFLTILLILISMNTYSQKLILRGDTMFKLIYDEDLLLSEAINNNVCETLYFTSKADKIVVDLKSNKVKFGSKRFEIVEVLEPRVGIFYLYELERKDVIYELLIGDNCRGGITVILRHAEDGSLIARYFPSVMLKEIK